jgi:quinol monooxygenase YgiN
MRFTTTPGEEALQVLRGLLGPVRSHPGCLSTRLMRDVGDEWILTWVEQWSGREDHERHVRSDAFRRLLAVMDLAAESPTFQVDEVRRRRGFELVEELLGARAVDTRDTVDGYSGPGPEGVEPSGEDAGR